MAELSILAYSPQSSHFVAGAAGVRSFDLEKLAGMEGGEYVLGMKDLNTHACYMIYGILHPDEKDRIIRPGEGHEEILCAADGPLLMHTRKGEIVLQRGHAVHIKEEESFNISNPTDREVVYVIAGGHCRPHH
jgi:hypothetical protein